MRRLHAVESPKTTTDCGRDVPSSVEELETYLERMRATSLGDGDRQIDPVVARAMAPNDTAGCPLSSTVATVRVAVMRQSPTMRLAQRRAARNPL